MDKFIEQLKKMVYEGEIFIMENNEEGCFELCVKGVDDKFEIDCEF